MTDMEKAEGLSSFFASARTGRLAPQVFHFPEPVDGGWGIKAPHHLMNLNKYRPDGTNPRVLRCVTAAKCLAVKFHSIHVRLFSAHCPSHRQVSSSVMFVVSVSQIQKLTPDHLVNHKTAPLQQQCSGQCSRLACTTALASVRVVFGETC